MQRDEDTEEHEEEGKEEASESAERVQGERERDSHVRSKRHTYTYML